VRPTADDQAEVVIGDLEFTGSTRAHAAYLRALEAGIGHPFMSRLFADSIPPGATVVDGDPYIGFHTVLAARAAGPLGRVRAFEPEPGNYRALRENVRLNGYETRVTALPLDIGKWAVQRRRSWRPSLEPDAEERPIDVVRVMLDRLGLDALRGMRRGLALSPEARVFASYRPRLVARSGTGAVEVLAELRELGFRARVIGEAQQELIAAGPWLAEVSGRLELLCEPASIGRRIARRVRSSRHEYHGGARV
jgi:hypothetical protein